MFEKKTKLVEPNIKKEVMDSPSCMYFSDLEDESDVEEPKPLFKKKNVKDSPSCMYFSDSEDKSDIEEPKPVFEKILSRILQVVCTYQIQKTKVTLRNQSKLP